MKTGFSPDAFAQWLRSFWLQPKLVDRFERMCACVGALFSLVLTGFLTILIGGPDAAWLIAPMGASAVRLFAAPAIHALGYQFVLAPVGLNSLLQLCAALFYNNLARRRYPHVHKPEHG
ncbi:MAG: HPP family protein [Candidatus Protistobacter heckmanni]|nr:HPP family protein [Candidatus Protistobacter heckmanni]